MSDPSVHQTSFGRPRDVYINSGLHIDVHWTSKGRLMPTGILLLIRLQAYTVGNFIKKTPTQVFSSEFCQIFSNTFLQSTSVDCFQDYEPRELQFLLKKGTNKVSSCYWKTAVSKIFSTRNVYFSQTNRIDSRPTQNVCKSDIFEHL